MSTIPFNSLYACILLLSSMLLLTACEEKLSSLKGEESRNKLIGTWEGRYDKSSPNDVDITIQIYSARNEAGETILKARAVNTLPPQLQPHSEDGQYMEYDVHILGLGSIGFVNRFANEQLKFVKVFGHTVGGLFTKRLTLSDMGIEELHCDKLNGAVLTRMRFSSPNYRCARYLNSLLKDKQLPHYDGPFPSETAVPLSYIDSKNEESRSLARETYGPSFRGMQAVLAGENTSAMQYFSHFGNFREIVFQRVSTTDVGDITPAPVPAPAPARTAAPSASPIGTAQSAPPLMPGDLPKTLSGTFEEQLPHMEMAKKLEWDLRQGLAADIFLLESALERLGEGTMSSGCQAKANLWIKEYCVMKIQKVKPYREILASSKQIKTDLDGIIDASEAMWKNNPSILRTSQQVRSTVYETILDNAQRSLKLSQTLAIETTIDHLKHLATQILVADVDASVDTEVPAVTPKMTRQDKLDISIIGTQIDLLKSHAILLDIEIQAATSKLKQDEVVDYADNCQLDQSDKCARMKMVWLRLKEEIINSSLEQTTVLEKLDKMSATNLDLPSMTKAERTAYGEQVAGLLNAIEAHRNVLKRSTALSELRDLWRQ